MFLHIGENNLVKTKKIIGVFDIDSLKESNENKQLFNEVDENKKTIIIADDQNYFSNIAVSTINKRINKTN